jgi:hypothetical protein
MQIWGSKDGIPVVKVNIFFGSSRVFLRIFLTLSVGLIILLSGHEAVDMHRSAASGINFPMALG